MMFQIRLLTLFFLLSPIFPQIAYGTPADPLEVRNILISEGDLIASDSTKNEIIDKWVNSETLKLDDKNPAWNTSNPQWSSVYNRIHYDLEILYPKINLTAFEDTVFTDNVSANIAQADVNAINAYYNSVAGKRYLDFVAQVNDIAVTYKPEQKNAPELSKEQRSHYLRILELSRTFQLLKSKADKGEISSSEFLKTANDKITDRSSELEDLYNKYSGNLAGFEAFNNTDAALHLLNAISIAYQNNMKAIKQFNDSSQEAVQQLDHYRSEWKKLYAQQTVK